MLSFEEEAGTLSELEDCEHRISQRREMLGKRAAEEEERSGGKKSQKGKGGDWKQQQRGPRAGDQRGEEQQQQRGGRPNWRDNRSAGPPASERSNQQQPPAASGFHQRGERASNTGTFKRPFGRSDVPDAPPAKTFRCMPFIEHRNSCDSYSLTRDSASLHYSVVTIYSYLYMYSNHIRTHTPTVQSRK